MQHVDQIFRRNVAGRRGRERAAADAAAAGVERAHAGFDRRIGVGEAGIAGVVEMRAQPHARQRRAQRADQLGHLGGHGDADGVGDGNFVGLSRGEPLGERHARASTGTSPSKGQPKAVEMVICARMPAAARGTRDVQPGVDALVDAAALVALAEAFAGGDGHADFSAAGGLRALEALAIEHQPDEARVARPAARARPEPLRRRPSAVRAWDSRSSPPRCARSPAATRRRMNSTLVAVGSTCDSLCRPSRGPTSTISMRVGFHGANSIPTCRLDPLSPVQRAAMNDSQHAARRARRSARTRARHAHRRSVLRPVAG